jgi:hypothetical protein
MGIDPTIAVSLRSGERAAAELAAIPDTEALRSADLAIMRSDLNDCVGVQSSFEKNIRRTAERYYDGSQPDFADASVMELFAYCVAREDLARGDLQSEAEFVQR